MEKLLAFENEPMINETTAIYNHALDLVRKVYNNYKKLELVPLSMEGLRSLTSSPDQFIKDRFSDMVEAPTFSGIQMKKANFIDTLKLPDYSPVVIAVAELNSYLQKREVKLIIHESDVLSCFEISKDKIQINDKELQTRLDGHRMFATSDKEKILLAGLKYLVDAYTSFDKMLFELHSSRLKDHKCCVFLKDPYAPELQMNENFYQQITAV